MNEFLTKNKYKLNLLSIPEHYFSYYFTIIILVSHIITAHKIPHQTKDFALLCKNTAQKTTGKVHSQKLNGSLFRPVVKMQIE